MSSMNEDNVVLVWRNISLQQWELETVMGDHSWIADMIIAFQVEVLKEKFADKPCAFVAPNTVQFFQQFPHEMIDDVIRSMNEFNYKYVFLPTSDVDVGVDHASHWSLVIMERGHSSVKFMHFDSSNHNNIGSARRLVEKLAKALDIQNIDFVPLKCPIQPNSYDCGVYVMTYMQALAESDFDHVKACKHVTIQDVVQCRKQVRNHILSLIKQ